MAFRRPQSGRSCCSKRSSTRTSCAWTASTSIARLGAVAGLANPLQGQLQVLRRQGRLARDCSSRFNRLFQFRHDS